MCEKLQQVMRLQCSARLCATCNVLRASCATCNNVVKQTHQLAYTRQLQLLLASKCRAGSNLISCHSGLPPVGLLNPGVLKHHHRPPLTTAPLPRSRSISCCKLIKITGANKRAQVLEYLLVCLRTVAGPGPRGVCAISRCKFSIKQKLHKMATENAKSHSIPFHFI